MTCGSNVFECHIPVHDSATIQRLLVAGADIVGKTNMNDIAVSGTGELSATGPVMNLRDIEYLAGRSLNGWAVAIIEGSADMALSTDRVRFGSPAGSGCVRNKPTHSICPVHGRSVWGVLSTTSA